MKILVIIALYVIVSSQETIGQTESSPLLPEIESKLKTGLANVSAVLTDNNYLPLHHETSFREMIRKYSTESPVKKLQWIQNQAKK